jgi:hypothetical protein
VLVELKSHRSGPPHRSGPTWLYRTYNCLALRHPDQPALRPTSLARRPRTPCPLGAGLGSFAANTGWRRSGGAWRPRGRRSRGLTRLRSGSPQQAPRLAAWASGSALWGSMVAITREDLQGALPDVTSTLTAAGLDGAVTIMRDQYGVPRACVPACCGSRCQARAHRLALLRA